MSAAQYPSWSVLGATLVLACGAGETVTLGRTAAVAQAIVFAEAKSLGPLNSDKKDENPTLTADELEVCFVSDRAGGQGDLDIWCATRSTTAEPFPEPTPLEGVNSELFETSVAISLDGLRAWWGSLREGGMGGIDIWHAERTDRTAPFSAPIPEDALNSTADDIPRQPGGPGGSLMLMQSRRNGAFYRTYETTYSPSDGSFSAPTLFQVEGIPVDWIADPHVSADGLTLFFTHEVNGEGGNLFVAQRSSLSAPFSVPQSIDGVNSGADDRDPWLSPDGTTLYFASNRSGNYDLYSASRVPPAP